MMVLVRSARSRLPKERQRQLPQPLRKGQAAGTALFIGGKIGAVVLEPCGQQNQHKAGNASQQIKGGFSRS